MPFYSTVCLIAVASAGGACHSNEGQTPLASSSKKKMSNNHMTLFTDWTNSAGELMDAEVPNL